MCYQKERFIQISKVDEAERRRREQQKQQREQVCVQSHDLWMNDVMKVA